MSGGEVWFFSEEIDFTFEWPEEASSWIIESARLHGKTAGEISFIFVSDKKLLEINKQYLKHKDYTDVITFDYSEGDALSGDIFISVERVTENAKTYDESFDRELSRVIIHGVLHLIGFKDKSDKDQEIMRKQEEKLLNLCPYLKSST